jgi:glutathione S-transferase
MDQAMNVNDWYLFNGVGNVIGFHRIIAPRLMGLAPNEEAIAAAMPKAHTVCKELARLLGSQPFFAGENLTLADLLIAPQLLFLTQTPEWAPLSEGRQNLVDWMDRMNARPSFKATTWERVAELAKAA